MLRRQCVLMCSVLMILTFSFPTWAGGRGKNVQEKVQAKQRRLSRDKKHRAARYLELSEQSSDDEELSPVEEFGPDDQEDETGSSFQPARPLGSFVEPQALPLSTIEDLEASISYSPSPDPAVAIDEIFAEWKADGRNLFNERNTIYRCLDILRALQKETHDSGESTFASEKVERILTCIEKLDHFDIEYIQLLRTYQSELLPYLYVLMMTETSAVDIYDILSGLWQSVRYMKVFTDQIKASRQGLRRGWWLASESDEDFPGQVPRDWSGYVESRSTSNSSYHSGSFSESSD